MFGKSLPSVRATEAALLDFEAWLNRSNAHGLPFAPGERSMLSGLVAEIRRYRAMLLGLFAHSNGQAHVIYVDGTCCFCLRDLTESHKAACPWPAFQAEVKAIRAERRVP